MLVPGVGTASRLVLAALDFLHAQYGPFGRSILAGPINRTITTTLSCPISSTQPSRRSAARRKGRPGPSAPRRPQTPPPGGGNALHALDEGQLVQLQIYGLSQACSKAAAARCLRRPCKLQKGRKRLLRASLKGHFSRLMSFRAGWCEQSPYAEVSPRWLYRH
jgi:hypothetical protein